MAVDIVPSFGTGLTRCIEIVHNVVIVHSLVWNCIIVHYNAYLEYGDEPYDSTYLRMRPESYNLGEFSCIAVSLQHAYTCSFYCTALNAGRSSQEKGVCQTRGLW